MGVETRLRRFWAGPGGAAEVWAVGYPLILSHISFTVQTSVDRLFLTWYAPEAVAGAVTGLLVTWAVIGVFMGTAECLTTFVAQYHGAGRPERIGPVLWQGAYFAILAGVIAAALSPLLRPLFAWAGHAPQVQAAEVEFARILMIGAFPCVLMAVLGTFFAGQGRTLVLLRVNVLTTTVNVILDSLWIFGRGGFPRWGVAGAAWATIVSQSLGAAIYLVLILAPRDASRFRVRTGWRLDPGLLARMMRFGLPAGIRLSLELMAFSAFLLILGRLGTNALAATGIAFSLNMIVFMPIQGLGIGVSSLVGRYLGAGRPELAERSTWTAFWLGATYVSGCCSVYLLAPRLLLLPYAAGSDPATFSEVARVTEVLLRFIALYAVFDMMNEIFASGLKGAGDTAFPLAASVTLAWCAMLVPSYIACVILGAGIYVAWSAIAAYIILLGLLLMARFRAGHWKSLRVIEGPLPDEPVGSSALG